MASSDPVKKDFKVKDLSPRLSKSLDFNLLELDPLADDSNGKFKSRQFFATHLSEGLDLFKEALAVKHPDSGLVLIANGRLVEHSGKDINDQRVLSLIGKAIELKLVPIA